MARSSLVVAAGLVLLTGLVAGCTETPAPVTGPAVGQCRAYGGTVADAPFDSTPLVACSGPHTAETFVVAERALPEPTATGVWTVDQMVEVGREYCTPEAHAKAVGLPIADFGRTRLTQAFFAPSPEQAREGARWIRCDGLVYDGGDPVVISERQADVVSATGAFARCIEDPPGLAAESRRCSVEPSDYAAVASVDLSGDGATYPKAGLGVRVRDACRRAVDPLSVNGVGRAVWTSTPPTQGDWAAGETYGLCWLAVKDWDVDVAAWPSERVLARNEGIPG